MPDRIRELARTARDRTHSTLARGPASNPAHAPENPIVALQRYIGNQGVQRLLQRSYEEVDPGTSGGSNPPVIYGPPAPDSAANPPVIYGPPAPDSAANPPVIYGPPAPDSAANPPVIYGPPAPDSAANPPVIYGPPAPDSAGNPPGFVGPPAPDSGPATNNDNLYDQPVGPVMSDNNTATPAYEY